MRNKAVYVIIAAVVVGSVLLAGTNFYLDLLWFTELDIEQVFWTQYLTSWGMRIGAWLFLFTLLFINLMLTRRYILSFPNLILRERLMATGMMRL
ncbi:MAG: UPF0182 family protein, partial [Dethiobacteria bacterium]|nr:UPF0182 family protein [Dethiobacteria bacterium]